MSSKYIFVDELMIRFTFVVDILREYADSRKFGDCNLVHWSTLLLTSRDENNTFGEETMITFGD